MKGMWLLSLEDLHKELNSCRTLLSEEVNPDRQKFLTDRITLLESNIDEREIEQLYGERPNLTQGGGLV